MSESTDRESSLSVDEWGATWGSPNRLVRRWMHRLRNGKQDQDQHDDTTQSESDSK